MELIKLFKIGDSVQYQLFKKKITIFKLFHEKVHILYINLNKLVSLYLYYF